MRDCTGRRACAILTDSGGSTSRWTSEEFRGNDVSEIVRSPIRRAAPWGALAVSLVIHVTVIGIGAAIGLAPPAPENGEIMIVADLAEMEVAAPAPVLLDLSSSPDPGGGENPHSPLTTTDAEAPAEPPLSGFSVDSPLVFGHGEGLSFTDVIGERGSGGGTGGGTGTGDGIGNGDGFFGLDLSGERFVFVVDASRSMNHPYPGEAKNRLGRVKIELYNTIRKMTADQSFFVVFFNTEPIPMPARGMVKAEPALIRHHLEWIFSARGHGQTNPESALHLALRLKPDKIYFLTDGDFSYRSVRSVREANRSHIPIHTIGFGGQEGEKNLREIARDSQGTYQFIPEPATDVSTVTSASKTTVASRNVP